MTALEKFRMLLAVDHRYDAEAYNFVYEALDWTLKTVVKGRRGANQHVTGQELLEGIRQYAIEQFGCLAGTVLDLWGVKATRDFGEIVFNLIDHDLMGKQESDSKADFWDVYDFKTEFDLSPVFSYASDKDQWHAAYVPRSRLARRPNGPQDAAGSIRGRRRGSG